MSEFDEKKPIIISDDNLNVEEIVVSTILTALFFIFSWDLITRVLLLTALFLSLVEI